MYSNSYPHIYLSMYVKCAVTQINMKKSVITLEKIYKGKKYIYFKIQF